MRKFAPSIFLLAGVVGCASPPATKSEYNLGVDSYKSKDYAAARSHWQTAVQANEPLAMNNLGYLLYNGLGGPVDVHLAIDLWTKSARAGNSESQWHVGNAYETGTGVSQSYEEAYAWYRCAVASAEVSQGDTTEAEIANDARKSLNNLLAKLSGQSFEAAEARAKKYIAAYAKRPDA